MTKESNNAEAAVNDDDAVDNHEGPTAKGNAAEGSLAPHALPGDDELAPEDLAVLPGHGQGTLTKRLVPAAAILALLALGVYSLTGAGGIETKEAQPQVAAQPAPAKPATQGAGKAAAPEEAEAIPEEETAPQRGLPMMMQPPAEDGVADEPDLGPYGPSVGRFPDLPPSVISYLKKVEDSSQPNQSQAPVAEPAADEPLPSP